MSEEKSWRHSIKFTADNIKCIDCNLQNGQLVNKNTCVELSYSIMLDISERLKNIKISEEIPEYLKSVSNIITQAVFDDLWQFETTAGLTYDVDESQNCIRITTEDGHCIEIEIPVFLELERRYFGQSQFKIIPV